MKWPFISRSSHEAMMDLWTAQVADLREERKILLDRLAVLGLGGPLFQTATTETESEPETEDLIDPDQELTEQLIRLRHRPSKLADEVSRQIGRRRAKGSERAKPARSPQVSRVQAELDEAEALGRIASTSAEQARES